MLYERPTYQQEIDEAVKRARELNNRLLLRSKFPILEGTNLPRYVLLYLYTGVARTSRGFRHTKTIGRYTYEPPMCGLIDIFYTTDAWIANTELLHQTRSKFNQLSGYYFDNIGEFTSRWNKLGILIRDGDKFRMDPEFKKNNIWDHWSEVHGSSTK